MLKNTGDNEEERFDLEAALDTMLSVLKYVNDIMHQVAITGYPVSASNFRKNIFHSNVDLVHFICLLMVQLGKAQMNFDKFSGLFRNWLT